MTGYRYRRVIQPVTPYLVLLLAAGGLWPPAYGQADVSGSSDHRLLERFPDSFIVEYHSEPGVNYNLVLGNLRRVAGRVVPEQSERLRGHLTRITYEAPEAFDGGDVFSFYERQAQASGYSVLFRCEGRGCGNSNYWANDIFNNRFLYGPERNQYYLALEAPVTDGTSDFIVIYVTTRANRRLLAHIEILVTGPDADVDVAADALSDRLAQAGSVVIEGLEFDDEDRLINNEGIDTLLELLQAGALGQAFIVAHLRGVEPLERAMDRSRIRAERVKEALADAGYDTSGLIARGVGPLAPACEHADCGERVELVIP